MTSEPVVTLPVDLDEVRFLYEQSVIRIPTAEAVYVVLGDGRVLTFRVKDADLEMRAVNGQEPWGRP